MKKLDKKTRNACPAELLDKTITIKNLGVITVMGADSKGIITMSDQHSGFFTMHEAIIRKMLESPNEVHNLIQIKKDLGL